MENKKTCTVCGRVFPATAEFFHRHGGGELRAQCKECHCAQKRRYRQENLEKVKERNAKYRANNHEKEVERWKRYREENADSIRLKKRQYWIDNLDANHERQRRYREQNAELVRAQKRLYRKANIEDARERDRRYRKSHKVQRRIWESARRARKRSAPGSYTVADIERQYQAQKGKCYYCGMKVGKQYHIDHVVPLSRGGSNSPENVVIACPDCNFGKNNKLPHEWAAGGRLL